MKLIKTGALAIAITLLSVPLAHSVVEDTVKLDFTIIYENIYNKVYDTYLHVVSEPQMEAVYARVVQASGYKGTVPRFKLVNSNDLNAWYDSSRNEIVVTTKMAKTLSVYQLEGVIAHEFAHFLDKRPNARTEAEQSQRESEADAAGSILLNKAGLSPCGVIDAMKQLRDTGAPSGGDHPVWDKRINDLERQNPQCK